MKRQAGNRTKPGSTPGRALQLGRWWACDCGERDEQGRPETYRLHSPNTTACPECGATKADSRGTLGAILRGQPPSPK